MMHLKFPAVLLLVSYTAMHIGNKQSTTPHTDRYDDPDETQADDPDLTFVPDVEEEDNTTIVPDTLLSQGWLYLNKHVVYH